MNYSKMFPDGLHCVICSQPRIVKDAHVSMHCERGEARGEWIKGVTYFVPMVGVSANRQGAGRGRSAQARTASPPSRSVEATGDANQWPRAAFGKRRLDPILARLVRAEQRKQNRSPR